MAFPSSLVLMITILVLLGTIVNQKGLRSDYLPFYLPFASTTKLTG
ncbi:hypothetical protein Sez_0218 [Streptococcus equi subsp. zooepidemicus MGCS10565]|uniref:Uncharacterized protein n=1 Tax=Streptococcus equi subsp. zooepidemicus (strain MGCS10565) TaxID=552526 RepID=B4U0Q9_STREM|nr:hypothetical protein Sez_0218 [Streptococcus equi subsp. zooepidemicus MGCS10565]